VGRVNVCCSAYSCYRIKMSSAPPAQLKKTDARRSPDKVCWRILLTTAAKTRIQPALLSQTIHTFSCVPRGVWGVQIPRRNSKSFDKTEKKFPVPWKVQPNKNTGFTHLQIKRNPWLGGYRPQETGNHVQKQLQIGTLTTYFFNGLNSNAS
jgi:hypothetical protein